MSEVLASPARSRSEWKWVKLADVGKVVTGNTPPTADAENYGDAIPFVKPTELVDRGIRSAPSGLASQAVGKARVVPVGAVLVSCIGNLGKTGLARVPVAFNQQINAVVFDENIVPEFGFYYLQTLKPWLYGESSATTIPIVNKGKFQQARFPLAPLVVQREIVAEIEKQFSRLDEAVANLQRVKANLKRYKAAILKAAVEGRLVETEASLAHREGRSYETGLQLLLRILNKRRAMWAGKGRYREPLPLDGNSIVKAPEGWSWAAVEMVCEAIVDCPHSTAKFQSNGYPCVDTTWMTTEGLALERARYVDESTYLDRVSRLAPKCGDIVFAREGTIGTAVLIPDRMTPCLGQRVMLLRASPEYLNGFLVHVLHSENVKAQYRAKALGSTVAHINVGDVKRFIVPVPPLTEQVRILAEVDRHLSIICEVEAEVNANLQRAQALRQATLAKCFSGGGHGVPD